MTVAIVARTQDEEYIVIGADRMLSHGDVIQAADDGALKARKLAVKWGMTFAGEGNRFIPIVVRIVEKLPLDDENVSESEIREAVVSAYREEAEEALFSRFLARYGYKNIEEFRKKANQELGAEIFHDLLKRIEGFDLGITLLIYGFDKDSACVFQVNNPGILVSHELTGCAAIGSGIYMATASLRRRPPSGQLENVIYRVLEAKFSAETASGVGRSTSLLILGKDGRGYFLPKPAIEKVRESWQKIIDQPDPVEAIEFLQKADLTELGSEKAPAKLESVNSSKEPEKKAK